MAPQVATEDLIDAQGVADVLGLSHRNTVSQYQRRYADMPRPVLRRSWWRAISCRRTRRKRATAAEASGLAVEQ